MNKQDFLKSQTCVLRVNIHCDGCKQKVKKKLQKIDGVYTVKIDSEQSKVTVTGDVDPATLVNKLVKSGKHAELWGPQKGGGAGGGFNLNNQFKNMQMDNFKGGKLDPKSQKGSGKDHNPKAGNAQQQQQFLHQMQNMNPKGGNVQQQQQFLQQMQNMKGMNLKDMKFPSNPKEQKNVKFNLPEEDDSEFGDEFDDEFDDDYDDDEFDDEYDDEFEAPLQHKPAKTIPIMGGGGHGGAKGGGGGHGGAKGGGGGHGGTKGGGGGHGGAKGGGGHGGAKSSGGGIMKGLLKGVFGSSVGKEKKGGGGGDMTMQLKGKGGKNEGKNGNGGKNGKGGNQNEGGKKGGKNGGGMPGEGKNGNGKGGNNHHGGGGGGGGGKMNGGGGNFMMNNLQQQGFHDMDLGNKGGMGDGRNMMGQMPQMGNHNPMGGGQMGNMQAVQGLPAGAAAAMNGGSYYQGMGQGNPYMNQQQQQQMAQMMMMNQQQQQQANGHGMYHPMMYARPQPPMYYGPPMAGHPGNDNYAHIFSDENTGSCSIM